MAPRAGRSTAFEQQRLAGLSPGFLNTAAVSVDTPVRVLHPSLTFVSALPRVPPPTNGIIWTITNVFESGVLRRLIRLYRRASVEMWVLVGPTRQGWFRLPIVLSLQVRVVCVHGGMQDGG